MRLISAVVLVFLLAGLAMTGASRADVPPPYEVYDIAANLAEGEPFPVIESVTKDGPADKGGVKKGDGVIAIDGVYSKGGGPFYFFARRLGGPQDSEAELVLLRDGYNVLTIKVKRTHRRRG